MLVSIPGIGKKLAERIIFELKEKVAAAGVAATPAAGAGGVGQGEVIARAAGARLLAGEARDASRAALAEPGAAGADPRGAGQGGAPNAPREWPPQGKTSVRNGRPPWETSPG